MGQRSVYDPRDPWAFRNTWTGEIRNSYDDLWIWLTLIVGITLVALVFLIPLLMHRYCRIVGFCQNWCSCFDRTLAVVKEMENERISRNQERKELKREYDRKFARPDAITYDVKRQLRGKYQTYHQYPAPNYDGRQMYNPNIYNNHPTPHHHHHHRTQSLPRCTGMNERSQQQRRSYSTHGRAKARYNIPKIHLHKNS